jgi:hypothetical protein
MTEQIKKFRNRVRAALYLLNPDSEQFKKIAEILGIKPE